MRDSRFPCSVHLDARKIQPRYADSRFPRSVQLVARMIHKGNEIKCGDFCVCFFKQHIINRQERYSFRATSCTLRSTINLRTVRNKVRWFLREFFQTTYYQPSRALFISNVACNLLHEWFNLGACLMISCNKLHATIHDFVHQDARYDSGVDTNREALPDVARTLWFK